MEDLKILNKYIKMLNTGELNNIRYVYLDIHKKSLERKLTYGEKYYKLHSGMMLNHILRG